MPRSKTNISKMPRALREPIEVKSPPWNLNEDETKAWLAHDGARIGAKTISKLCLLMDELKIPKTNNPLAQWVLLFAHLARKLYPGFLTTSETRPKGRPRRGQRRVASGGGELMPDLPRISERPEFALVMIDLFRHQGVATDKSACERLLTCEDPSLSSPHRRTDLERKTRSLASVIATMRRSAKRQAHGKLN